jgi:hypothetical protein
MVATVPAYQWLYSPRDAAHHHFRRYSKKGFRSLWRSSTAEQLLLSHYHSLLFPAAAAVRLASKLKPAGAANGDLRVPRRIVNGMFKQLMGSEKNLLGRFPIPFGLSLIGVVRKIESATPAMNRAA